MPLFKKKFGKYILEMLLLTGLTVFFLGLLFHHFFTNHFYYFAADISELYYPWWVYLNEAVRTFSFPLLNRFWFMGSLPFASLETSVFYPPYLIIQFAFNAQKNLDTAYFYHFGMEMAHYLLASLSFYLLSRIGLKLNKYSSIFGAVIYSCSGVFVGRFLHTVVILTLAWLPLLYLFYILFIERKKLIYALLTSVVLSLIITSGHPQMIYYVFLFFGIAVLYYCFIYLGKQKVFFCLISFGIILLSLLVTAPKILLTYELSRNIIRTTTETTIANLYNSIHPFYYLTLLIPYLFGKHFIGYWGSDYPWGNWENFLYLGILPILVLPLAKLWQNKKMLCFFFLNFAFCLFLLLGKYNFLSALVNRSLPFSDNLTMLSKLTNHSHFFLAVLVAIALNNLFGREIKRQHLIKLLIYCSGIGLLLLVIKPTFATIFHFTDRPVPSFQALAFIAASIDNARLLYLINVIILVLFIISRKKRLLYILVLIYAFDIFSSAGNFNPIEASPGKPSVYFGSNVLVEKIKTDQSIFRVENLLPRNANMIYKIETTSGYHTIETKAYQQLFNLYNLNNREVLNLMNIKYFISDRDLSQLANFRPAAFNLWENQEVLPRIYYVPNYRVLSSSGEMVDTLIGNFNPTKEVLFLKADFVKPVLKDKEKLPEEKGQIQVTNYSANLLEALVKTDSFGYLVISQLQYPGWQAKIDGKKQKLLPANLVFYALPLEAGQHKISIYYDSKPLKYGLGIMLATVFLIILTFMKTKWRKFYFTNLTTSNEKDK